MEQQGTRSRFLKPSSLGCCCLVGPQLGGGFTSEPETGDGCCAELCRARRSEIGEPFAPHKLQVEKSLKNTSANLQFPKWTFQTHRPEKGMFLVLGVRPAYSNPALFLAFEEPQVGPKQ